VPADARAAKLLTKDEARRIAVLGFFAVSAFVVGRRRQLMTAPATTRESYYCLSEDWDDVEAY
jgi:hypothetical protein